jgi:ABC-type multidrug transport system permease subunit
MSTGGGGWLRGNIWPNTKASGHLKNPSRMIQTMDPPILDFMSIFAGFIIAVIAAYYTITYFV